MRQIALSKAVQMAVGLSLMVCLVVGTLPAVVLAQGSAAKPRAEEDVEVKRKIKDIEAKVAELKACFFCGSGRKKVLLKALNADQSHRSSTASQMP